MLIYDNNNSKRVTVKVKTHFITKGDILSPLFYFLADPQYITLILLSKEAHYNSDLSKVTLFSIKPAMTNSGKRHILFQSVTKKQTTSC